MHTNSFRSTPTFPMAEEEKPNVEMSDLHEEEIMTATETLPKTEVEVRELDAEEKTSGGVREVGVEEIPAAKETLPKTAVGMRERRAEKVGVEEIRANSDKHRTFEGEKEKTVGIKVLTDVDRRVAGRSLLKQVCYLYIARFVLPGPNMYFWNMFRSYRYGLGQEVKQCC